MHLIRTGAIEGYFAHMSRYGKNPNTVLEQAGMSVAQLREPDALVSYRRLADLLDFSSELCDAPLFSLELASTQNPLVFGDLALFSGQRASLEDVLNTTLSHIHLHAFGIDLQLSERDKQIEFSVIFEFHNAYGLNQLKQLTIAQMFNAVTTTAGEKRGAEMYLMQSPSTQNNQMPSVYSSHLNFSSHFDGIRFPKSWLRRKPVIPEKELRMYFEQRIQHLENAFPNNLEAQTRYIINNLLPSGECNLERVAAALNIHPRVLQRRLKEKGSKFRELLEQTRLNTAQQLLSDGRSSITDIALNLGYAEVAVFSRHFKKWTGLSPRQWKQQHRLQASI